MLDPDNEGSTILPTANDCLYQSTRRSIDDVCVTNVLFNDVNCWHHIASVTDECKWEKQK